MSMVESLEVARPAGLWRHWKTVAGLLVVFAAGAVIGGVGTIRIVQRAVADKMNAATWTPRTLQWLRQEAKLTPEQESLIRPSVEKMTQELIELRSEAEARRREIFGRTLIAAAVHLSPPQQELLRAAIREKERTSGPPRP